MSKRLKTTLVVVHQEDMTRMKEELARMKEELACAKEENTAFLEENEALKRTLADIEQSSVESSEEDEDVEEPGPNVEEARQEAKCARLKIGDYEELMRLANDAREECKEKMQKAADALKEAQTHGRLAHKAATSAFHNMEKDQEDAEDEVEKTNQQIEAAWVGFNARARQLGIAGLPTYP